MFEHSPIELNCSLRCETTESGRKYVTPEGNSYDSITTVLGKRKKKEIMEWRQRVGEEEASRISKFAAGRGNALHSLVESYLKNEEIDEKNLMPHLRCLFGAAKKGLVNVSKVYLQEKQIYSDYLKVAGRLDLCCEFSRRTAILDVKTSSRRKVVSEIEDYFMQACAYSIMVEERTGIAVPRLVILMCVDNDPEPLVMVERRDTWVDKLVSVLKTHQSI